MAFFKTKIKKLTERIESLESELGVFYHVDSDGFVDHKEEKNPYSGAVLSRVNRLEDAQKEEKNAQLLGKGAK